MPGSSLWLLPPAGHPLNAIITSAIEKTSDHFNSPHLFLPHITLTSEISPSVYGSDPQAWLDDLDLTSGNSVHVEFRRLQSEPVFFRKLYIKVEKSGIVELGKRARKVVTGYEENEAAAKWADSEYNPHISLLYHDCPQVDSKGLSKVDGIAKAVGLSVEGLGEVGGWQGGRVVLVPTDSAIIDWAPIAERKL